MQIVNICIFYIKNQNMNFRFTFIILSISVLLLSACKKDYTPKPLGYNRIDLPFYKYIDYSNSNLTFKYADLAKIQSIPNKDSLLWFNINYPSFNATIYCSYIKIKPNNLKEVLEDSYHLAYSHSIKADGISQNKYQDDQNRKIGGIIYELDGDVATPIQFFITDSTSNFLRGSFYYNSNINLDSIKPITDLVKKDIIEIFNSIKFQKK